MTLKIKELPNSERPYEKLEMYGEKQLSNSELLAIIIKTGTRQETSVQLAQRVLTINKNSYKNENNSKDDSLNFLQDITLEELKKIKGIGRVKAIQIKALCELSKRMNKPINEIQKQIKQPEDIAILVAGELQYEKREIAKVILLNTKNIVQKIVDISFGGVNFAIIEPKEVFAEAVKLQMPRIVLIHNHPSGDARPSKEDILITERLDEAGEILGIELLDHIVIGKNKFTSIRRYQMSKKEIDINTIIQR